MVMARCPCRPPPRSEWTEAAFALSLSLTTLMESYVGVPKILVRTGYGKLSWRSVDTVMLLVGGEARVVETFSLL